MRIILLCFASLTLTSCVYYGDIHGQAKPYTAAQLNTPNQASAKPVVGWWQQFRDPELNHLVALALTNSPSLQATEARLRKATAASAGAAALRWPTLDFSGFVSRQKFAEFGLVPPPFNGRTFNIADAAFNFNYDVDLWGKNRQLWQATLNEQQAAAADVVETHLVLSAAVATSYFQLQNLTEQTRLAQQNWQLSRERWQIAATRKKHGIDSDIPVQTLQSNAQSAKQAYEQFQQGRELARHQLAVLLGDNPMLNQLSIKPGAYHPITIQVPASLPANLLAQRPDIWASKLRAEAAANRINVANARFFPDINLNGLFSYQAAGIGLSHFFLPESQTNGITGAVDLPIFDAGLRRANLGARYAEYDKAVSDYNQTILTALQQVADQLAILHALHSQLASQRISVATLKRQYNLIHSRYNHGIADYTAVIESKQLLLQQQATLTNLQAQHQQAMVAMLKALGGTDTNSRGG